MDNKLQPVVDYILAQIEKRIEPTPKQDLVLRKVSEPEQLGNLIPTTIYPKGMSGEQLLSLIQMVMQQSVVTNHPYFMNQMYGKTQPIAYLADVLITLLNTSMYTYEVAPILTLIEKETIDFLTKHIWGEGQGDGVFTAGGSMSNMKALFLARQRKMEQAKFQGLSQLPPVAIFISEQAHYSFVKGVNFMGFGIESLIKIPSDSNAKVDLNVLEQAIEKAKEAGRVPLMLVGIAGTTISGTYDDLDALADIAQKHNMWYHVDACYGGALLFSQKERKRLKGIEKADSVSWNFHKVMGMPLSTASFLTRKKGCLNKAFNVEAGYLFHEEDYDYDLGQKSLQGGRRPDVFKLWLSLQYVGAEGFEKHVDALRDYSKLLASMAVKNPNIELFQEPESSIVCFRYVPDNMVEAEINQFNIKLRENIFQDGKMIFNYAQIHGKIYLRFVILDSDFGNNRIEKLLETINWEAKKMLGVTVI
jgi:sulfinoalanine decarboxylase